MSYYPEFTNFIESHLTKEDRSASWLASRLKIDPDTVARWLNDGTRPGSPEMVARIADVLLIEKAALLIAAGYAYQDATDVTDQMESKGESQSNEDISSETGGDINFHDVAHVARDVVTARIIDIDTNFPALTHIQGNVILGPATIHYHVKDTIDQEAVQETAEGETSTESSE